MDWPRARGILLIALTLVNLVLAYSIWGPTGVFPELTGTPHQQQVQQVEAALLARDIEVHATVPKTPDPMPFLRVQHRPTVDLVDLQYEFSGRAGRGPRGLFESGFEDFQISLDPRTQVVTFRPKEKVRVPLRSSLGNLQQVLQETTDYLRAEQLLPGNARFSGVFPSPGTTHLIVEYVPDFAANQVFSGFIRAEVSWEGIEAITQFWVQPLGFKEGPPKAVRPAAEALLRLAGHLEQTGQRRIITEIRLGYYSGGLLTTPQVGTISAWDTVPVWRIRLETGETYYINAFNGEIES